MIFFLYGEDTFRSRQKVKEFKDRFLREVDKTGNSLTIINGGTADLGEITEAVEASSLLTRKRMAVIEEIFSNKDQNIFKQLTKYLEQRKEKKDDNIIIFWDYRIKIKKSKDKKERIFKIDSAGKEKPLSKEQKELFNILAKQKHAQYFELLNNVAVAKWAKKEVENRGGKMSSRAIEILVSLVGADLWQIDNEINKLINFKLASQPKLTKAGIVQIEEEDVLSLVRGNFDENIFALTDAISNKNKALAAKLLEEEIESGADETYILSMVIRQFKILLGIRQALDENQSSRKIINLLKIHPFVAQKGMVQARRFNLITLKNIFNQLVRLDYNMKSGKADIKTMLDLLIAKI